MIEHHFAEVCAVKTLSFFFLRLESLKRDETIEKRSTVKPTPAPQSPCHCCPWSWKGCWQGFLKRTTWPAGGSAGNEASAGEYCLVWRDTGSSSGRSKQLEKVWSEQTITSGPFFQQQTWRVAVTGSKSVVSSLTPRDLETVSWRQCDTGFKSPGCHEKKNLNLMCSILSTPDFWPSVPAQEVPL